MIETALLSVPEWDKLNGCRGIVRDRPRRRPGEALPVYDIPKGAKCPYDDHLEQLGLSPQDLLIVIGARNLGSNLGIVAYCKELGLLQLSGENANEGARDYYCICCMADGGLEFHRLRFFGSRVSQIDGENVSDNEAPVLWALSGQPLVWESATDLGLIIESTYDLRHFYRIHAGEDRFGKRSQKAHLSRNL